MADPRGDEALAELLRAAAPTTVPPAGFDHGTVLAVARRAQARRRRLLAGGAAAVVVVLAGGGAASVLGGGAGEQSTASSAVTGSAAGSTGAGSTGAGGIAPQLPQDPAAAGTAPGVGPQQLGAGTCGPTDRAVHAALQQALPELAARPPYPLDRACPDGTTGAGVAVSAGGVAGRLEVLLGPAAVTATDGATGTATTADGRTVTIVSVPAAGSSTGPYADRLDDVARRVAAALG